MKFFTRELYERCQSDDDAVLDAAEEEWESALQVYEQHLEAIVPQLPAHLREFQELLLHDAVVQSIAREGDRLFLILRKDIPPRDLVILTYELESEPALEPFARCPRDWARPTDFNFDEFDVIHEGGAPSTRKISYSATAGCCGCVFGRCALPVPLPCFPLRPAPPFPTFVLQSLNPRETDKSYNSARQLPQIESVEFVPETKEDETA
jgi:hypothetical protein